MKRKGDFAKRRLKTNSNVSDYFYVEFFEFLQGLEFTQGRLNLDFLRIFTGQSWLTSSWHHQSQYDSAISAHFRWSATTNLHSDASRFVSAIRQFATVQKSFKDIWRWAWTFLANFVIKGDEIKSSNDVSIFLHHPLQCSAVKKLNSCQRQETHLSASKNQIMCNL